MEVDIHVLVELLDELGQGEGITACTAGKAEAPGRHKMDEAQQRAADRVVGREQGD